MTLLMMEHNDGEYARNIVADMGVFIDYNTMLNYLF